MTIFTRSLTYLPFHKLRVKVQILYWGKFCLTYLSVERNHSRCPQVWVAITCLEPNSIYAQKLSFWASWQGLGYCVPIHIFNVSFSPLETIFSQEFWSWVNQWSELYLNVVLMFFKGAFLANQTKCLHKPGKVVATIWSCYNYCHLRKIEIVWIEPGSWPTV